MADSRFGIALSDEGGASSDEIPACPAAEPGAALPHGITRWRTAATRICARPIIVVLAWLTTTLSGSWALMAYANRPGDAGAAPALWPEASCLSRPTQRPRLITFLHPRCACSRASLGELALLMTHCFGQLDAEAVFIDPAGMDAGWAKTDLWRAAAAIPGVEVMCDAGGREARTFRTATSGDTLLYAADGRLLFHGGITLSRGHAGENPGRRAIEALLQNADAPRAATPVFGCPLFSKLPRGT